ERRRIREVLALKRGAEALGFSDDHCSEPACWQLTDPRLEREPEPRPSNYSFVSRCVTCGNMPLTHKQRKRLIDAAESASREAHALNVRTPMAQYRSGSWQCQHNRRWFLTSPQSNGSGGRPAHAPTRPPHARGDEYVCDCGWDDDTCWAEHQA